MINVRSLTIVWWDYMAINIDRGMTLTYRENFMTHRFMWFTDLVGMARPIQLV